MRQTDRSRRLRIVACVFKLILILASSRAEAQYVWAVDFSALQVKPGDIVYVKDTSGAETGGLVKSVSTSALIVGDHTFSPAMTEQIDRRGDSLANGLLIGAAAGFVVGIIPCPDCGPSSATAGAVLSSVLFGAGLGAWIDHSRVGRTVVFRQFHFQSVRVAPTVGNHRFGIALSF